MRSANLTLTASTFLHGAFLAFLVQAAAPVLQAAPWRRHTIDNASRGADGVRLADVNGDGRMDIATGWEEGGVIRVYLNPGPQLAGRVWPAVTVGRVQSPEDAVFVDLDGDGAVDVVSSCEGRNRTMYVHWAPKEPADYLDPLAWTTTPIPATQNKQMWMFALPMQVDGERGIDLVAGAKGAEASVGWLQSPNQPRQLADWSFRPLYEAGWIMSLVAWDMDGDGDSPNDRHWTDHDISGPEGAKFDRIELLDLDDDGDLDVITCEERHNLGVFWYENPTVR